MLFLLTIIQNLLTLYLVIYARDNWYWHISHNVRIIPYKVKLKEWGSNPRASDHEADTPLTTWLKAQAAIQAARSLPILTGILQYIYICDIPSRYIDCTFWIDLYSFCSKVYVECTHENDNIFGQPLTNLNYDTVTLVSFNIWPFPQTDCLGQGDTRQQQPLGLSSS